MINSNTLKQNKTSYSEVILIIDWKEQTKDTID